MKAKTRGHAYEAIAALAAVSLALAVAVTAGLVTEEQVSGTLDLALRFATALAALAGAVLARRHLSGD